MLDLFGGCVSHLIGTRLAKEVEAQLAGSNPTVNEIASALGSHYTKIRASAMEHEILKPRGLDLSTFYGNHASLNQQITMMVDNHLTNYDLGVELLLTGVDSEGAHVYIVQNPGGPELQHDVIGYAAIGSGAIHAVQSMIGFGHHPGAGFMETLFRVYASKKRSEAAPGVGQDTDLLVISQTVKVKVEGDLLDQLDDAYESFNQATQESLEAKLQALTNELQKGASGNDGDTDGQGSS